MLTWEGTEMGSVAKRKFVPANASANRIYLLSHDNVNVGDFSIMTDGFTVWLSEQAWGEMPKQKVAIPRYVFNKLIDWYTTGVVPREDAASRKPPSGKKA